MHSMGIMTLLVAWSMVAGAAEERAVPQQINYQGRLLDGAGDPITGERNLRFWVFEVATGGEAVWGPRTFNGVDMGTGGYFNVLLGRVDEFPTSRPLLNAFAGTGPRFLAIELAEPGAAFAGELDPRQQVLSTPYALQAANGNPVGAVQTYYGVKDPEGWLVCDGRFISVNPAHSSRTEFLYNPAFTQLVAHLCNPEATGNPTPEDWPVGTAKLPDLRGVFVRGLDTRPDETWRDPQGGRTVGHFQDDLFELHNHNDGLFKQLLIRRMDFSANHGATYPGGGDNEPGSEPLLDRSGEIQSDGGAETRPKNVALNYIVKY